MKTYRTQHLIFFPIVLIVTSVVFIIIPSTSVIAGSYNGQDLALAILENQSTLVSSSYTDTDASGHSQAAVINSPMGYRYATQGSTFILLSTGIAGTPIITTNAYDPGSERGSYFHGKYDNPRDQATLTLTLRVPPFMHYLYYDAQFFTAEYPDYLHSAYNDKFTVTVNSPSKGTTQYVVDVNSGDFVLNSNDIPGTGFDIFATDGNPSGPGGGVDMVTRTPRSGVDGGATALIRRENPVSPNELITVTFDIKDTGDNQFDSAAFIDNVRFSGYAKTEIIARKTVQDLNGGFVERNDTLKYTITISNTGDADQWDNQGNEFDDMIPKNTTYVPGSATATSGAIGYNTSRKNITWNGAIPARSSVAITFEVTVNQSLFSGAMISNQGTVYWDSNECHKINEAMELTDDPGVNDGIDQDGDGETGDDDPTIVFVTSYESPETVTEDFSNDVVGAKATQSYVGIPWFETSMVSGESNFEVAASYYYATAKSFKTKLRSSESPQYWNYTLSGLKSDMKWWEAWFTCGNVSESADLFLNFTNTNGTDIAKIKFEYVHQGLTPPTEYVAELSYWDPVKGWTRLDSDYSGGYLFNGWYQLHIEKYGPASINYTLNRTGKGIVDSATGAQLGAPFSNLKQVIWSTTKNPVVCPLLFWDEHRIGLVPK